ncbi:MULTISPECIES: hypothetical protein [unclassified Actinoplanes]|uniref:hypothetical protein n=1 Tax=unclassified Actinoplanes TaxID=2626549 RepID=UPI0012BA5871|nr:MULTISPECIES: hypothetical protein [unclassified Actinoplanes]
MNMPFLYGLGLGGCDDAGGGQDFPELRLMLQEIPVTEGVGECRKALLGSRDIGRCLYEPVSVPAIELLLASPHCVPRPFGATFGLRILLFGALLARSHWYRKKFAQWGQVWFFETGRRLLTR